MTDLADVLRNGPAGKGKFLSRVFGIFSEEIVRIWARDSRSAYNLRDKRPVLGTPGHESTLDFLLERRGKLYVAEMKCEIEYRNYRYWRLTDPGQLDHHLTKPAFDRFLKLSRDPRSIPVRAGTTVDVAGTVLIWGSATPEGAASVMDRFGIADVLTVEEIIGDLREWQSPQYVELLDERERWMKSMLSHLRSG